MGALLGSSLGWPSCERPRGWAVGRFILFLLVQGGHRLPLTLALVLMCLQSPLESYSLASGRTRWQSFSCPSGKSSQSPYWADLIPCALGLVSKISTLNLLSLGSGARFLHLSLLQGRHNKWVALQPEVSARPWHTCLLSTSHLNPVATSSKKPSLTTDLE